MIYDVLIFVISLMIIGLTILEVAHDNCLTIKNLIEADFQIPGYLCISSLKSSKKLSATFSSTY